MTSPVNIVSPENGTRVRVTKFGQLVTAPLAYSDVIEVPLDAANEPFNLLEPIAGQSIVITDVIVSANRQVSTSTPAQVEIYESDGPDSGNVVKGVFTPTVTRGERMIVTGINLLVPEGVWLNARTDDTIVYITVMYYRVPQESV